MSVPFRALGVLLGLLFAPLRLLLIPSLTGMGRRPDGPDRLQVPITPFVLATDTGTHYDCIIRGEVRGGFIKLGEDVVVAGRVDRTKVLRADRVESRRTGAVTKGWVDPRTRMAPVRTLATLVMIVVLVMILVSVFGAFTN